MQISNITMQWPREGLYLTCFSHEVMNYRYHWHPSDYELSILLHGSIEHCQGTEIYHFQEDDVVLVNPGIGHASFGLEANTCTLVLQFSASSFRQFHKKATRFYFPSLHSDAENRNTLPFRQIRFYTAQILQAACEGGPYAQLTVKASIEMLLSLLCRNFEPVTIKAVPEQDEHQKKLVASLVNYVDQHYNEKLSLDDLAQYAQYNRTYVSTLFKNIVGINFYEYLTRVRFQNALVELATTNKTLTDIAISNGFSDLKSFSKRFRETLHRSPSEYRGQLTPNRILDASTRRFLSVSDAVLSAKLKEYLTW